MRKVCTLGFVLAAICMAGSKGTAEDEVAIRKVLADSIESFNRHEANLTPAGYSDDFDMVNPAGARRVGKPDLGEAFKTFLKNARSIETVQRIRFIGQDVALVDAGFELTGTDLKPYPKGMEVVVLVKEHGRWVITALRVMIPVAAATPAVQQR